MKRINRRYFLKTSAAVASALSTIRANAQNAVAPILGAGAGTIRIGLIGCGGRGCSDLSGFLKIPNIKCIAVCDVDDAMIANAMKAFVGGPAPAAHKDFRRVLDNKDIDVVIVGTPDHWHALPTINACQAGKDVYVEKPTASTIAEGRVMVDAARKYIRVVQVGAQWPSSKHFQDAIAFVQSGQLGKIRQVRAWAYLDWFKGLGKPADGPAPAGVDYDFWLGPAPKRPFNTARFHFSFRCFWDYAGGLMTDWGIHLINIVHHAMKVDAPTRITSHGGKLAIDDIAETPDTQIAVYDYPGFIMTWEHQAEGGLAPENYYAGIAFYGTEGKLTVNSKFWEVVPEKNSKDLKPQKNENPPGVGEGHADHVRNFLECVVSRKRPIMDVALGHSVSAAAHLGNIALLTKSSIEWDAKEEKIKNNPAAAKLLPRDYRAPWVFPTA
jgi:predicted dehydrogenase